MSPERICPDEEPEGETLGERLWGLTEMFPKGVQDSLTTALCCAKCGIKNLYSFSRTTLWIAFSSSAILIAPLLFEVERAQVKESQMSQQKQMLLGPNTAMVGGRQGC